MKDALNTSLSTLFWICLFLVIMCAVGAGIVWVTGQIIGYIL